MRWTLTPQRLSLVWCHQADLEIQGGRRGTPVSEWSSRAIFHRAAAMGELGRLQDSAAKFDLIMRESGCVALAPPRAQPSKLTCSPFGCCCLQTHVHAVSWSSS
jgi:hypothetical protein